MLERMWRKGKPLALLVGMQTDTVTMENSMEISLKTKNKTTIWSNNPTTEQTPRRQSLKNTHVSQCSLQYYSLQPGHEAI